MTDEITAQIIGLFDLSPEVYPPWVARADLASIMAGVSSTDSHIDHLCPLRYYHPQWVEGCYQSTAGSRRSDCF